MTSLSLGGVQVTASASNLNALSGLTADSTELNVLDGITASTSELNIMKGVTADKDEINLLDGATGATIVNNKAVVYGSSGEVDIKTLKIDGTAITTTAAQLNNLTGLTATATDLNKLSGLTGLTSAELGYVDGVTSSIQTQLDDRYTKDEADARFADISSSNAGGNFTSGSIGGSFGNIITNNQITTTDTITGGRIQVDDIVINNSNIGYSADQDLLTLSNNLLTVAGTVDATTVDATTLKIGTIAVTATADELNIMDGVTATTDEINILDGVTATKDEINVLDTAQAGTVVNEKAVIYGTAGQVAATTATVGGTLAIGSGSVVSSGTINFGGNNLTAGGNLTVSGNLTVTGTTTTVDTENVSVKDPLMLLSSGATVGSVDSGFIVNRGGSGNVGFVWDESNDHFAAINTSEDGTTAGHVNISSYAPIRADKLVLGSSELTETVLATISGVTAGTSAAGKAVILDSNKHIDAVRTTQLHIGASGSATQVTSTAAELNLVDGSSAGTVVNNKAVVYGSSGEVNMSKLQIGGTDITSTAAELNILDGVTATTAEINYVDGVTSNIQTQLDDRYTEAEADAKFALKTEVAAGGNFTSGSIGGSFGSITTSSTITGGSLVTGDITIGASKIGHSTNNDLIAMSASTVVVDGTLEATTLKIGATNVATELSNRYTKAEADAVFGATTGTSNIVTGALDSGSITVGRRY